MITANITNVNIGLESIEGLMWVENDKPVFGVGVPQIAKLFKWFQDSPNKASQKLKRLMGEDFKTHKIKTSFNRNATLVVLLDDFLNVIKKLAVEKKQEDATINPLQPVQGVFHGLEEGVTVFSEVRSDRGD